VPSLAGRISSFASFGGGGRKRRGDVQHVVASRHRLVPAPVAAQIRLAYRQTVTVRLLAAEEGADLALPRKVTQRGAEPKAATLQLDKTPGAEEARSARDEHGLVSMSMLHPCLARFDCAARDPGGGHRGRGIGRGTG
jgi:hypothetical protein